MADFTAADVKALREKTGCGMMDCKKALTETGGDMRKAADFLREKGLAAAAKKSARVAAEGVAYAKTNKNSTIGAVVEVNTETDFVAKNSDFMDFVELCADTIIENNPNNIEDLVSCKTSSGEILKDILNKKIATIGENIKIRRFKRFEGFVTTYVHANGRIAVMLNVKLNVDASSNPAIKDALKDIAMQIAAVNPGYLNRESVPSEVLKKEKNILKEQVLNEGKPESIVEKIVMGKLNKFYKENCLLEQDFVKDNNITVEQYLKNTGNFAGANISILDFTRYEKGEGITKKEENFAEEVAGLVTWY
jgi:elongation factor Ts